MVNGKPDRAVKMNSAASQPASALATPDALRANGTSQMPSIDVAMTDVEPRVAPIEHRIERVEIAEVEVIAGIGERAAQIVLGVARV